MPAQTTPTLNHQPGAALGAARRCGEHVAGGAGNEHLALAATIPIDGDSLATQLVRELVRGSNDVAYCPVRTCMLTGIDAFRVAILACISGPV